MKSNQPKNKLSLLRKLINLSLITTIIFISCQEQKVEQKMIVAEDTIITESAPSTQFDSTIVSAKSDSAVSLNHYYNDIAKFISGLPVASNSRFYKISKSKEFTDCSRNIDISFLKYRKSKLQNLISWRDSAVSSIVDNNQTVLYPFSGPDITYAYSMFPKAKNYFLFGLEPVGIIPDIESCTADSIESLFKSIHTSISDNLNFSFFITRKMSREFNSTSIKGTIPRLMFFMARLNLHVQNIQPINIDTSGIIQYSFSKDVNSNKKRFRHGVDISFYRPNEKELCHVYYFSLNINNKGFDIFPQLGSFINSMKNNTSTLIKSASYCLHNDNFSVLRELILKKSDVIIQDDTGVPFRYINDSIWSINLNGKYTRPIPMFTIYLQEDYREAFEKSARPINFRYGYAYPSNILVAKKKTNKNG